MKSAKRIIFLLTMLIITVSAFAVGNKEVPQVPPVTSGVQYLSPNGDGVQDEAELSFTATVNVKSKEGYIPEYSLTIYDENGNIMKEVIKKEKSDLNWFIQIFTGYKQFEVSKSISWDGLDKDGNAVPDGVYSVKLKVIAASKQETTIDIDNFIIDTVAPTAQIAPAASFTYMKAFSPNDDGQKDYFVIDQSGTNEAEWTGEFIDESGNTAFSYTIENSAPSSYTWDGLKNDGTEASDGNYTYRLSSTDLAGNSSEDYEIESIILDRTITVIEFAEDVTDPRNRAFSPNGDGVKETLTLSPVIPYQEEVTSWIYTLMNSTITTEPEVYIMETGTAADIPLQIILDGTDSDGDLIPESDLDFELTVSYSNGNIAQASLIQINFNNLELDNTPPVVKFLRGQQGFEKSFNEDEYEVFSPNGDGKKDEARIVIDCDEGLDWVMDFYDFYGNYLGAVDSEMVPGTVLVWDGKDLDDKAMPDGTYLAQGDFYDYAGNYSEATRAIMIDTRPVNIVLKYPDGFSPNGDGSGDTFVVNIVEADQHSGISSWEANFYDDAGMTNPVYSTGGTELPDYFEWDGIITDTGVLAGDGLYAFSFKAVYEKGDEVEEADQLMIEYIEPNITVDQIYAYSSDFAITGQVDDPSSTVTVEIDGRVFSGTVDGNTWSADVSGIDDGTWDVQAVAFDSAGNMGVDYSTNEVFVDSSGPLVTYESYTTNDTTPVVPGTTRDEGSSISYEVNGKVYNARLNGENWTVSIDQELASGVYPVKISAVSSTGAEFNMGYPKGLIIDTTPPQVEIKITSNPFSRTDSGVEGEMYVSIQASDDTGIADWTLDILEKGKKSDEDATIRSYSGDGDPSDQIAWSGEVENDAQGHIVEEFTLVINVTDMGGNTTVYREDVPLDIIVVKKDGKLFLMVPNIIFGAYQHTLDSRGAVMEKRNWDSIRKVVEIYNRYPMFGLGLEAHALNIYEPGTEKWEAEEQILLPLTERRAETVRKALESLGITADRILSNAYGGVYPIASTTDPKEWWKNRRVEFIMLPPTGGSGE